MIEPHSELLKIVANVVQHPFAGQAADVGEQCVAQRLARGVDECVHVSVRILAVGRFVFRPSHPFPRRHGRLRQLAGHASCQIENVLAPVGAVGEQRAGVLALHHPQPHGKAQHRQLPPGIVDVVLAPDFVAGGLKEASQAVADRREPAMPHMQGSGGIGGHELHQHLPASAEIARPVGIVLGNDADEFGLQRFGIQPYVDESGSGGLDAPDQRMLRKPRGNFFGNVGGRTLEPAGELHRGVGGIVPVARIPGLLQPRVPQPAGVFPGYREQGLFEELAERFLHRGTAVNFMLWDRGRTIAGEDFGGGEGIPDPSAQRPPEKEGSDATESV